MDRHEKRAPRNNQDKTNNIPCSCDEKGAMKDLGLNRKIPGKRTRGGQRKTFSDNFDLTTRHLWDSARSRKEWHELMVH